jgi:hypothetical protein
MNFKDDYAEFSVEGEAQATNIGVKIIVLVLIVVGFYLILTINSFIPSNLSMLGTLLIGVYLVAAIVFFGTTCHSKNVEYDYLFVENDLEIDAVYDKSKRKHIVTVHMEHAKCIAPLGSQAVLGYEGKGAVKVRHFEAADTKTPYVIVVEKNGVVELLIEPDEHLLSLMQARNKDIFYKE